MSTKRGPRFTRFLIAFLISVYSPMLLLCAATHNLPNAVIVFELLGRGLILSIIALGIAALVAKKGKSTSAIIFGLILFLMNLLVSIGNLAK